MDKETARSLITAIDYSNVKITVCKARVSRDKWHRDPVWARRGAGVVGHSAISAVKRSVSR